MLEQTDFCECRFIDEAMWFYTFFDFCDNRKSLKRLFATLTKDGRLFYKWYVYSNIHMNIQFKNAIWDYLNNYDPHGIELLRLKRTYKVK